MFLLSEDLAFSYTWTLQAIIYADCRWKPFAVFVCGRMGKKLQAVFFNACGDLLRKERKAVESNNHPTYAGQGMISISL
jgi:hypothetical protein